MNRLIWTESSLKAVCCGVGLISGGCACRRPAEDEPLAGRYSLRRPR
jgi:hypothetical protein